MTVMPSESPLVSAEDCSPPFLGGQSLLKCLASIMSDDDNDNNDNDYNDNEDDDENKKYFREEEKIENEIVAENFDYVIWFF